MTLLAGVAEIDITPAMGYFNSPAISGATGTLKKSAIRCGPKASCLKQPAAANLHCCFICVWSISFCSMKRWI